MPVPLLETLVDGHPDVKVDLGLGDVVAGEELTQTGGVLLQHVAVVLPAAALREHLRTDVHDPSKPNLPTFSPAEASPAQLTPGFR